MTEKQQFAHVAGPDNDIENSKEIHITTPAKLETVPSRVGDAIPVAEIRDGGFKAWIQVLGCFFLVSTVPVA